MNAQSVFFARPGLVTSLLATLILAPTAAVAVDPNAPVGELDVERKFVRSGSKVNLEWNISYPTKLDDILKFDPGGGFTTSQDLDVTVHAIGMEFSTGKSNNGHGNNLDGVDVSNPGRGKGGPNGEIDRSGSYDDERKVNGKRGERTVEMDATLWVSENGTWQELFQGGVSDLGGDQLHYSSSLPMGTSVNLAAQGKTRRGSNEVISTTSSSPNLIVLKNGDPLPSNVGAFQADKIASFLTPYVTDRRITLGPLQMIYLFDLDAAPGSPSYTLQDLGVLVSVKHNDKRTKRVGRGPEISQFNGNRRSKGNRGPEFGGNKKPRGDKNPRSNKSPRANDNAPADSPTGQRSATGGGQHAGGSINKRSSAKEGGRGPETDTPSLRQLVYEVDIEAVLKELGMTLEELEALLRDPDPSKQAELLRRIQELKLFTKGSQLLESEPGDHERVRREERDE